jgi:hypothetical protein
MTPEGSAAPWGYVMTVVWVVTAFVISAVAATGCLYLFFGSNPISVIAKTDDGVVISVVTISSNIVQIAVLALVIQFRHWPLEKYLALKLPRRSVMIRALLLMIALLVVLESATALFGSNNVPPFQVNSYRTAKEAGWLPALFAAVVVFAPLTEEIVFRGFLYRGFVRRPGHEPFAIVIISLVWTAAHIQYDFWGMAQIFVMGILLGALRWWSGSTSLTISLHVLANFLATLETVVYVEWLSK